MRILADFTKLALGVVFAAGLAGSAAAASLLTLPTKPPVLTGTQVGALIDEGANLLVLTGPLTTIDMGSGAEAISATIDLIGTIDPSVGPFGLLTDVALLVNGVGAAGFDPTQDFLTGLSAETELGLDYIAVLFTALAGQGQPSFGSRALLVFQVDPNSIMADPQTRTVTATGELTLSAVSIIPLPATAPLLLGALGAVAVVRRRRAAA